MFDNIEEVEFDVGTYDQGTPSAFDEVTERVMPLRFRHWHPCVRRASMGAEYIPAVQEGDENESSVPASPSGAGSSSGESFGGLLEQEPQKEPSIELIGGGWMRRSDLRDTGMFSRRRRSSPAEHFLPPPIDRPHKKFRWPSKPPPAQDSTVKRVNAILRYPLTIEQKRQPQFGTAAEA